MDKIDFLQFTDLFKDYVSSQQRFQTELLSTLRQKEKSTSSKMFGPTGTPNNPIHVVSGKGLAGEIASQPPAQRTVKKQVPSVNIASISPAAAKTLKGPDEIPQQQKKEEGGGGGFLKKILGPLLLGATAVLGGGLANKMGIDTSALTSAMGLLGKILKKLPLIGLLISTGEALSKFKKGGPKNIISGLLDIAGGISYMFPGIGTAIGLGIDVLNYFFNKTVDNAEAEGRKAETFGDIFSIISDAIKETKVYKWFSKLGDLAVSLFTNPGVDSMLDLFDHIGLTAVAKFISSLDKGVGGMLGLTNEYGEATSLTDWLTTWISDSIILPIQDFFGMVAEKFMEAINFVKDYITEKIKGVMDFIKNTADTLTGSQVGAAQAELEGFTGEGDLDIYKTEKQKLLDEGFTEEDIKSATSDIVAQEQFDEEGESLGMESSDEVFARKVSALKALRKKGKDSDEMFKLKRELKNAEKNLAAAEKAEDEEDIKYYKEDVDYYKSEIEQLKIKEGELQDFVTANNKTFDLGKVDFSKSGAIITNQGAQTFTNQDTIIGFKEGEALVNGIQSLIDISSQQLEKIQMLIESSKASIVSSSNQTYNFNVDSGVKTFRKYVN